MSFLFQGQAPSIYFDQDNQRTTRVKGISTVVIQIAGATYANTAPTLVTATVKGLDAPNNASAIPGDAVFVQPLGALAANTVILPASVTGANQITIPFVTVGTAAATSTLNYLVTIIKFGQLTGLDA